MYLRDPQHLIRVMSTNPSYLQSTAAGDATQYRDWGVPLGRRFRALKLWYQLRIDGIASIQDRLRRDLENAQWIADEFAALDDWELVAPVRLQTVCIRHNPNDSLSGADLDAHTLRWVRELNSSGRAFLSPSQLDDQWMVRISVGAESTERSHLERLVVLIRGVAEA